MFRTASARLDARALRSLRALARELARDPGLRLAIDGHADQVGSIVYNQRLSEHRSISVAKALQRLGVGAERLTLSAHGESQPTADNDTAEGRQQNRRVELRLLR